MATFYRIVRTNPPTWTRTTNSSGHFTPWGEPAGLLEHCVAVAPVA